MSTLRPVGRTLLRDTAYVALRDAIVCGELAPGEPVRDVELAARLGLSRAPVRDALARLVEDGLVETKPQSYTRVTRIDTRAVREAGAVVGAMHELATRTAVPSLSAADVAEMRAANDRFAAAVAAGATGDALNADDALHDVLVRVCGNRAVTATIARYTPLIRRLEWRLFATRGAWESAGMHERLIAACETGDVAEATAVTAHIWSSLTNLTAGVDHVA
ncbi:GntR family transcriptional regulator [Streptomyces sp. NPDC017979]|uniref:GntR family transcriptional regulator n=1 Tax=Streptomyces sp. NPDC017979 TaxID=3365024 RepID=UPI0037A3C948